MEQYKLALKSANAFMPKLAFDFAVLIEKQAEPVYTKLGIIFPVITSSTIHYIGHSRGASLVEIARALDISHQLSSQRIKSLLKLDIIEAHNDKTDKRRTVYTLSSLGLQQYALLMKYLALAEHVFVDLNRELNADLCLLLNEVNQRFNQKSLFSRIFDDGHSS